jgi:hypothetical protein
MCKFGDVKCIYSHSKQYLDEDGWWNDEEEVAIKEILVRSAQEIAREQREIEEVLWSVRRGRRSIYRQRGEGARSERKGKGKKRSAQSYKRQHSFTESEIEELMCQGVKPWDDDARVSILHNRLPSCVHYPSLQDVLRALNDY